MKKALKRTLIITGSIATALILTILILTVIVVRPLEQFIGGDYNVSVVDTHVNTAQNGAYESEIKDKLDTVKFSVMRSLLEFNADYKIQHAIKNVDGEDENKKIAARDFLNVSPRLSQIMLKFSFDSQNPRTNENFKDDDCNLIKFDTLIIVINEPTESLQPVVMYPYLSANLNNSFTDKDGFPVDTPNEKGEIHSAYYSVYEFNAKMYTSKLYDFLIDKGFKAGAENI